MQGHSDPNRELLDAAALCRKLVPEGSVEAFLADHRQELFPDELFEDLFPSGRGRPSVPADVIASVMVLQALEGLSDRDAARALSDRISWKVACGLALDEEGFHPTVLTYWRNRLRASGRPERIFDAVRAVVEATGVLKGRSRRALDSTLLDDAVATQDTVTQIISAIRRVRREVPAACEVPLTAHDYEQGAKPVIAWDDPVAKDALVSALVTDASALLESLEGAALSPDQIDAVGLLGLVAGQDVEPGEDPETWRIVPKVAPDRVISTVDPEARHMHKSRSQYRDGYKAHVAVEPDTGIITAAALTPANAADGPTGVALLQGKPPGLEVLADSAYGSGQTRAALAEAKHLSTIKPIALRSAIPGGFTIDDFAIDTTAGTVTCPQGHTVSIARRGGASFGPRCQGCPLRHRCSASKKGRTIHVHPHHDLLVSARRRGETEEFKVPYRSHRPMVERSIAWLVADGHRRVRYRGVARNQLGLSMRVAAINLRRLINLGLDHQGGWVVAA
ncbi:MAG TPA: IS1182 family transposase [Actinomycetota bacterium]|nr:IS1182 family transposase [Actinomycetota bacterium]